MNYEHEQVHYHLCELNFELVLFKNELAQHCRLHKCPKRGSKEL